MEENEVRTVASVRGVSWNNCSMWKNSKVSKPPERLQLSRSRRCSRGNVRTRRTSRGHRPALEDRDSFWLRRVSFRGSRADSSDTEYRAAKLSLIKKLVCEGVR